MPEESRFGGHSMVAPLRRVLICTPEAAGWPEEGKSRQWRDLGYIREPDAALASAQHGELRAALEEAGAEVLELPPAADLTLDAVYAHDASLVADSGAVLLRMGKAARRAEPARHGARYRSLDIPILGAVEGPGLVEAGDVVWLDDATLLVGRGYRTNAEGIGQLAALLKPRGVEVIDAPLPHGQGSEVCLHLMSLLSLVGERKVLVDPPWLAVQTIDLLLQRGFELIRIDPSERETLACNVLALGNGKLLAIEENPKTHARLRAHGFDVRAFPGSEICFNGAGGPTCLTRPLLRR